MISKNTKLNTILKLSKECKQCGHCCSHTSGFVLPDEIKIIAKYLKIKEDNFVKKCLKTVNVFNKEIFKPKIKKKKGKPYGSCIFFDKNCTIHDVKPLHCQVSNCNEHGDELNAWFMLNYVVDEDDPESLRQWNIYLKTGGKTISGGNFTELVPDLKIRRKLLNYGVLR